MAAPHVRAALRAIIGGALLLLLLFGNVAPLTFVALLLPSFKVDPHALRGSYVKAQARCEPFFSCFSTTTSLSRMDLTGREPGLEATKSERNEDANATTAMLIATRGPAVPSHDLLFFPLQLDELPSTLDG